MSRALLVVALLAACAHAPAGELRFLNQPPVWRVNDRVPLAKVPAERPYVRALYHTDGFVVRRVTRALDLPPPRRAADVNSLDEVPDSTWFTNRIGVRDLALDELRRGANLGPSPFDHRPWTIKKAKSGGTAIGFVFEDARGDRYILKFDAAAAPEMETGAHAIVHRILWACGFNVPEDYIGYVRRDDLRIAPGATLTDDALDAKLAKVFRTEDGRIRVLASRYLPGKPIGPYAREGTRVDDPNDVIPHERRRSLRGQFAIFAWLNHTDLQEDNTLDIFVRAPAGDGGHVVHYLIDFGKALGVMGYGLRWQTVGYTYRLDLGLAGRALLRLGLWERPWEEIEQPPLRGIGLFEAAHYDPGAWRPNSPYWPYEDMDRHDAFWGAKILMRFTPTQLATIVDEAQYSDPASAAYMLRTLIARQRATARYWFDRVAPLDHFVVTPDDAGTSRLCFSDLALAYKLHQTTTRYEVDTYDRDGRAAGFERATRPGPDGRACITGLPRAPGADAYTIVRLRVRRRERALPDVRVHLARDHAGGMRIIGLRRD